MSQLAGLMAAAKACGWWWPFRNAVILTPRPSILRRDAQNRLHCETGPAIAYLDGWSIYAWHGVRVPRRIIEAPETLTAKDITTEGNVEVRRVMLERFTHERYIRESGARVLHRDDWGTLWWADLPSDEPLVVVEVLNSTPEPDGSFKRYMLRVHPDLRPLLPNGGMGKPQELTARNAVASTFGLRGEEYGPIYQT